MKPRDNAIDARYERQDDLEGYLRDSNSEHRRVSPKDHHLIILLNEVKPVLRSVRRTVIHSQQFPSHQIGFIRDQNIPADHIPMQINSLSGYHLRPLGQVAPVKAGAENKQIPLRAIKDGQAYSLISSAEQNLVTPDLAQALERVFEKFALRCGFTSENPVSIEIRRGFEAGDRGHSQGMAADIQAVGGQSIAYWAQEFAKTMAQAKYIEDESQRQSLMAQQTSSNLGYLLYRTLLEQGGWRIYNQVVQLFGPWTPRLGPWKRLHFEYPDEAQARVQYEQERIYRAHRDHIHVAFG